MSKNNFKKNIESLKIKYKGLADKLENLQLSDRYSIKLEKGLHNIYDNQTETFYYASDNPSRSVQEDFRLAELKYVKTALVLGLGLGYELMISANHLIEDKRCERIIIVERDLELFYYALQLTDFSNFFKDPRFYFFVDQTPEEIYETMISVSWRDIRLMYFIKAIKAFAYRGGLDRYGEYYKESVKTIKRSLLDNVRSVGNDVDDSLWGVNNMLQNIDYFIKNPGINLLKDKFKGKTAVVVASGPSLDKNIKQLKGRENEFVIICADSALSILRRNGITPHFTVMIERPKMMKQLFESLEAEDMERTYFIPAGVVHREALESYLGEKIIAFPLHRTFNWLAMDKGFVDFKLSAGNMTFSMAEYMGCDKIIIVGQDLSFGEDNKTHAKGMPIGSSVEAEILEQKTYVKGNYADKVLTHTTWERFLNSYSISVTKFMRKGGLAINCTAGGALIHGAKLGDFKGSLDAYTNHNLDVYGIVNKALSSYDTSLVEDRTHDIISRIDNTIEGLNFVVENIDKAQKIYDEYGQSMEDYLNDKSLEIDKQKFEDFLRIGDELNKLKKPVSKNSNLLNDLFVHVFQSYLVNHEIQMNGIPNLYEDNRYVFLHQVLFNSKYFQTLRYVAIATIHLLKKSKNNIVEKFELDIALEEIDPNYNLPFESM